MCGQGARSRLLYKLRFQGGQQQSEGRLWHRFRAGRHSRSPRGVVAAEARDLHMEPPEVGAAARRSAIRPWASVNGATYGVRNIFLTVEWDPLVEDKAPQGANMNTAGFAINTAGFATVNPSSGEEIEQFSYFTPA